MKKLRIRCSELGIIMTNGRGKNASMGLTAKSKLREIWVNETFGRHKVVLSREMTKGIEQEETSLSLYTQVKGELLVKNETNLHNEWLTGTPDVIGDDYILDIKTSWDIFTFANVQDVKDYEWQLRGYMMLTGKPQARLVYCLVNNPPQQISDEMYRLQFKFIDGEDNPEYERAANALEKLMVYDDIDPKLRVKEFIIDRDLDIEEQIKARVEEARAYFKTLTL